MQETKQSKQIVKSDKVFVSRYVEEDEVFWKKHIETHLTSGLSKRSYCKENRINYARFFYWIKKFSQQPKSSTLTSNQLLPVQLIRTNPSAVINKKEIQCTLVLKNGCELRINDHQSLSQILTMWG
jgi:hypothetical protein